MKFIKLFLTLFAFFIAGNALGCTTPTNSTPKGSTLQGSPEKLDHKKTSPFRVVAGAAALGELNLNAQNNAQQPAPAKHKRILFPDMSAAGVDKKSSAEPQHLSNIARLAAKPLTPLAISPTDPQLDKEIAEIQIDGTGVVTPTNLQQFAGNAASTPERDSSKPAKRLTLTPQKLTATAHERPASRVLLLSPKSAAKQLVQAGDSETEMLKAIDAIPTNKKYWHEVVTAYCAGDKAREELEKILKRATTPTEQLHVIGLQMMLDEFQAIQDGFDLNFVQSAAAN